MPYRLDAHVLTVDANIIHKVDTGNPANLYTMWTGKSYLECIDRLLLIIQSSRGAQTLLNKAED
jgi:hypothetical protein